MSMYINRIVVAVLVMTLPFLLCDGCSSTSTRKVIIKKQFLFDIEKALQEELKSGDDKSKIYNELWERNYSKLVYLVKSGDEKAIDVAISLIGQKTIQHWSVDRIKELIDPIFWEHRVYATRALEKKRYNVQIRAISALDIYHAANWSSFEYLNKHPEVKKLYENKYGDILADRLHKSVSIDRQFLYDIEKALQQESKTGEDRGGIYNNLWENNYDELIYLTAIGDIKAIDVTISLVGQENYPALLYECIEPLIKHTFEGDYDRFWEILEKKDCIVQVRAIHVFDFYKPIDWEIEPYFAQHPKIKKLYEDKYGLVENDVK